MKCPLQGFEGSKWGGIEKVEAVDCLKEECAWWDGHGGFCSILKIDRHLESISKSLENIAKELTLLKPPGK